MTDPRRAARALDALARGWQIALTGDGEKRPALLLSAVETAPAPQGDPGRMLIASARAITLKLANQKAAAQPDAPALIRLAGPHDAATAMAIADPSLDLAYPFKGPFAAEPLDRPELGDAAMRLARLAGLLPAFYKLDDAENDVALVSPSDIAAFDDPSRLAVAARARLPVAASEQGEIIAFRSPDDPREHVALVIGERDDSPPLVRLHSECLTGDVLGSLKCDCGPQLSGALKAMAQARWGILLYLRQEGRGIGLINKLRAYQLQDQGFDTVDANNRLGFATDARDFGVAARMLKLLHVDRLRLLTNNPDKVAALAATGIEVVERLPLSIAANPHNADYLVTKRDRTGHQL